jgi:hypothetical protein
MDLKEALGQLAEGKKIRRRNWPSLLFLKKDKDKIVCFRQETILFDYDLSILDSVGWSEVGEEDENLSFSEAVERLFHMKKITLNEWPEDCYLQQSENGREIYMKKDSIYSFVPTFECLSATDWEVI